MRTLIMLLATVTACLSQSKEDTPLVPLGDTAIDRHGVFVTYSPLKVDGLNFIGLGFRTFGVSLEIGGSSDGDQLPSVEKGEIPHDLFKVVTRIGGHALFSLGYCVSLSSRFAVTPAFEWEFQNTYSYKQSTATGWFYERNVVSSANKYGASVLGEFAFFRGIKGNATLIVGASSRRGLVTGLGLCLTF
jgi:hypothetical protein